MKCKQRYYHGPMADVVKCGDYSPELEYIWRCGGHHESPIEKPPNCSQEEWEQMTCYEPLWFIRLLHRIYSEKPEGPSNKIVKEDDERLFLLVFLLIGAGIGLALGWLL